MPQTYEITAPNGKTLEVTGDRVPTETELRDIFKAAGVETGAPPQTPAAPVKPMTMLGRPVKPAVAAQIEAMQQKEQARTNSGYEDIKGLAKSALGTVEGVGRLARSIPVVGPMLPAVNLPFSSEPTSPEQAAAKTVGNVAQFFLPAASVAKVKTALTTGIGVLDALAGAAVEGSSAAGVQAAQQGTTKGTGTTALIGAGTTLATGAALKAAGWLGERIENALVRPSIADSAAGFKVQNIFKYDLGGTLSQSYDKTVKKITQLSGHLQQALAKTPGSAPLEVDVLGALADASAELSKNAARNFGSNTSIQRAVDKLLDDPMFQGIAATGTVDLSVANQVKQAVGELGAWLHDPSGRVMVDPDSKAMETVANTLYAKLKTAIEQTAVGPIKDINRQLSEVIPVRMALIRRIPVEARQNMLNLGDIVGMSTGQWGISLANRLLKSGRVANTAVQASRAAPTVASVAAPAVAGTASQMNK